MIEKILIWSIYFVIGAGEPNAAYEMLALESYSLLILDGLSHSFRIQM